MTTGLALPTCLCKRRVSILRVSNKRGARRNNDPTVRELDPALTGAVLTADAAKLAASADYSPYHQAQRVMPADPHHSGAALIPSTTVGEAVGQERRPSTAANVDSCYGHESKTMTIYRECLTPAEANPPSVSEHRVPTRTFGLTSRPRRLP